MHTNTPTPVTVPSTGPSPVPFEPADDARGEFDQGRINRTERNAAAIHERLNGTNGPDNPNGPHAGVLYRGFALQSSLTNALFRLSCVLISFADNDLSNCFPSREAIRARLGTPSLGLSQIDKLLRSLQEEGWIERWPLSLMVNDELCVNYTGKFGSAVGTKFCIPAKIIARGDPGWEGPWRFDKCQQLI